MAQFRRTWWGQKFIAALETFSDSNRLSRGRTYARGGKVKKFEIKEGTVVAQVRGSINPYFGVYKEPLYNISIEFEVISRAKWSAIIGVMAAKAGLISRLLLNEIPENIEGTFNILGVSLLPHTHDDFKAKCSCPDWSNPCKHIAGVYYLIASEIDQDPFLLFELRGISRDDLKAELAKSPLGQALSAETLGIPSPPKSVDSYFTQPVLQEIPSSVSLKDFWQGAKPLPKTVESAASSVSAVLIKKQGDYPAFWHRDNSFIKAMEEFYQRIRTKNKDIL